MNKSQEFHLIEKSSLKPFWERAAAPRFIGRTDSVYAKVSMQEIKDRGMLDYRIASLIENLPQGAIIAGGSLACLLSSTYDEEEEVASLYASPVQGKKVSFGSSDIDIFFTGPDAFYETLENLMGQRVGGTGWIWDEYKTKTTASELNQASDKLRFVEFESQNKDLPKLQLIKLCWYDDPAHVIDTFDLTVVQFATDGDFLYFNPLAPLDLARKRIVLHRMQFPASTMRRVVKYAQKGYYACPGSLVTISEEIQKSLNEDPTLNKETYVYLD